MLCVIRAYQFQSLIREAEQEAEERTRDLMQSTGIDGGGESSTSIPLASSASVPYGSGETVTRDGDYNDLELSVEQGQSA